MIPSTSIDVARQIAGGQATETRMRRRLAQIMWFLVALVLAVSFFFPLYFMITGSFKENTAVVTTPIQWWPQNFQGLTQYQKAFELAPLLRYLFNSALMAGVDVIVTVFFSALAGYGFAKFNFRGKRLLFLFILSTIMIPFQVLVVPLFIEIRALGWDDSYYGLIVPGIMNAFGVFMMRQFAYSIPNELLDAARIDGASEIRIFWQVVFPLLSSASASLATIIFLFSWNNFLWPLVVIKSEAITTLPVGLTVWAQPHSDQPQWAAIMAMSTIATLPVGVLFVLFQRYFIEGLVLSGMKG